VPTHPELANFIWSVADLLRGDYKQSEYGKVILPFTVLRRLDCVIAPTRQAVWAKDGAVKVENRDAILYRAAGGLQFYNVSRQNFATIGADPANVIRNLVDYYNGFSASAREILDKYNFHQQITRLHSAGLLYKVVQRFADIDLSPKKVDNHQMGYVFEELIRKFSEISNETAGEHFTPREVIELMVNLLLAPDADTLNQPGQVINILDPACGTGGMLSAAEEHITSLNPHATVALFGQEVNAESYAICRSDMLIKGQNPSNIVLGNSFSHDAHRGLTFDYMLANPPFGVEWKKVQDEVTEEFHALRHSGRFGAGLPRINDGSLLFLQHMISKMKPVADGGTRLAIVFNGSPLFSGAAGSGESEIRRWILENDWLEAIVALPDQLFYNTGLSTYFWIVTNRKAGTHRGKVILLDARRYWAKMRKSLGDKRKIITREQITQITQLYAQALAAAANPQHAGHREVQVFTSEGFGYQRIAVDRPLRQRFEITEDTLAALDVAKPLAKYADRNTFIDALKPLIGTAWPTRETAADGLRTALAGAGIAALTGPVERAMRAAVAVSDPKGELQTRNGKPLPDPDLRGYEDIPLAEDIDEYLAREVLPHVPDAWIAEIKDPVTREKVRAKIGYEIPFTRLFYTYSPPRPLTDMDAEVRTLESQVQDLLAESADITKQLLATISEELLPQASDQRRRNPAWPWLPDLPADRPLVRLGYVCRLQTGLTVDGARDVDGDVVTRPYLRVANVQAGRVDLDDVAEITVPRAIAARCSLRPGDVLMTEGGDLDKLGRGTVWRGEIDGCLHQNHVFALRPDPDKLDADYLALLTQSFHGRCYFESTGVKTTNLASTNSSKILAFPVPLPELDVQRHLVSTLSAHIELAERTLTAIDRQMTLLGERRLALITTAVTGQMDASGEGVVG
jgi:type I restriction enzyme M protein